MVPAFHHVWLFVFENRSFESVIGNPRLPFLNSLADHYTLATRAYAVSHPSLPNYLAMIGGSTFGCGSDSCAPNLTEPTLVEQLDARRLTWAAFYEDLPAPGYTGDDVGGYVRHHDPFVYFTEIRDTILRLHIHPLTSFESSLANPPSLTVVGLSNTHNMHNGSVAVADAYARRYVGAVLASAAFRDHGVVIVTWDESFFGDRSGCCGEGVHGGNIPLIVAASDGLRGVRSAVPHDTYSILRTIEDGFGLPHLRHAGDAGTASLRELWP